MYLTPAVLVSYDASEIVSDAFGTPCTGSNCAFDT
jgi:hypothetical protein